MVSCFHVHRKVALVFLGSCSLWYKALPTNQDRILEFREASSCWKFSCLLTGEHVGYKICVPETKPYFSSVSKYALKIKLILKGPLNKLGAKTAPQTIEWSFTFYFQGVLRNTKKTTKKSQVRIFYILRVRRFRRHRIINNSKNSLHEIQDSVL